MECASRRHERLHRVVIFGVCLEGRGYAWQRARYLRGEGLQTRTRDLNPVLVPAPTAHYVYEIEPTPVIREHSVSTGTLMPVNQIINSRSTITNLYRSQI